MDDDYRPTDLETKLRGLTRDVGELRRQLELLTGKADEQPLAEAKDAPRRPRRPLNTLPNR